MTRALSDLFSLEYKVLESGPKEEGRATWEELEQECGNMNKFVEI